MESETKICEHTGEIIYKCSECDNYDYADLKGGPCFVCWSIEHHPEDFVLTKEQDEEWKRASEYVMKHNITANVDFPE